MVPSVMESPILGTWMVILSDSGDVRAGNAAMEKWRRRALLLLVLVIVLVIEFFWRIAEAVLEMILFMVRLFVFFLVVMFVCCFVVLEDIYFKYCTVLYTGLWSVCLSASLLLFQFVKMQ